MSKKIHEAQDMVRLALINGPKTVPELAEYTSINRTTVRLVLKAMRESEAISVCGGVYELAKVAA